MIYNFDLLPGVPLPPYVRVMPRVRPYYKDSTVEADILGITVSGEKQIKQSGTIFQLISCRARLKVASMR